MLAVIIMIITIIMITIVIVAAVGVGECTMVACEGGEGKGRWVQGVGSQGVFPDIGCASYCARTMQVYASYEWE